MNPFSFLLLPGVLPRRSGDYTVVGMPQLSGAGGGGGGDPELCATDEMIPFKDEGDPQKEKIFADSCGAREVRSPCAWRGGARPGSRVTGAPALQDPDEEVSTGCHGLISPEAHHSSG